MWSYWGSGCEVRLFIWFLACCWCSWRWLSLSIVCHQYRQCWWAWLLSPFDVCSFGWCSLSWDDVEDFTTLPWRVLVIKPPGLSSGSTRVGTAHRTQEVCQLIRVAHLQSEVGMRSSFELRNFLRKMLRNFPEGFGFPAQKNITDELLQGRRENSSAGPLVALGISPCRKSCLSTFTASQTLPIAPGPAHLSQSRATAEPLQIALSGTSQRYVQKRQHGGMATQTLQKMKNIRCLFTKFTTKHARKFAPVLRYLSRLVSGKGRPPKLQWMKSPPFFSEKLPGNPKQNSHKLSGGQARHYHLLFQYPLVVEWLLGTDELAWSRPPHQNCPPLGPIVGERHSGLQAHSGCSWRYHAEGPW